MKKLLSILLAAALVAMPMVPAQASYFNAITQKVITSTNNNYTAPVPDLNISNGATVTRTGESTLNVAGIQVNFIADKNFTIYIDQSMDNSNWDITDTYKYQASTATGVSFTVQATASYFRIRMKNTDTAATTYVRLQTALCPIVEAVPRSLDEEGNFKVCVRDTEEPETGHHTWVGESHELRVSPITKLVGTAFSGSSKETSFWAESNATGTGAVSQTLGNAILTTGATAASTIQYQSVRAARWVPGQENVCRIIMKLNNITTANVTRNWGIFDATNGCFFQLDGSTLNIVYRANAGDTPTAKSLWNVDSSFVLDANYHIYEIRGTYAGLFFYIDNLLVHKLTLPGQAALYTQNLSLPITMQDNKTSGATICTMTVPTAFASRAGQIDTETTYKNLTTGNYNLKYSPGRLKNITVNNCNLNAATVTIYDGVTAGGVLIATLLLPKNAATSPFTVMYDCPFNTGLYITTSAAVDITVTYE